MDLYQSGQKEAYLYVLRLLEPMKDDDIGWVIGRKSVIEKIQAHLNNLK